MGTKYDRTARHVYISNPLVINEEASRRQAMKKIGEGATDSVCIHKHSTNEECLRGTVDLKRTVDVGLFHTNQCYVVTKETT